MNIDCPWHIGGSGRTASACDAKHVRDMIELMLFTVPGERVMQPSLGSGLMQYAFAPNSPELAATLQLTVQGALNQWLGDVIDVVSVSAQSDDATLTFQVGYVLRASGTPVTDTFSRSRP
ncbi:GPW/gp25 family protein [Paraburkholderia sp. JPY432]|uniref:GPW/gp25 family protein n=1 Tax=Paraburkholderia youngii TaxID=2782701 RepID=UPI001594EEBD|nr:GPW/gp25 family protein [Paraburkholderia youngii]NVH74229.1 GPW/gp25 family protein [Paraburkholderia youngii]